MLLAAGLGTRMRPLTAETAKPLLPLGGRALIDHALDRLTEAGICRVVVNTHWQAERVAAHLADRRTPQIVLRQEPELLDTGGAIRAALDLLGPGPFLVVNGDSFFLDGPTPTLARLAAAWGGDTDAVLLLDRVFQVRADVGHGDFALDPAADPWGTIRRPAEHEMVPYVFAGVQLLSPTLFDGAPDGAFSMNVLWDAAIVRGRLRALVHDGLWFHLSRPEDLMEAEYVLHGPTTGDTR